METPSQDLVSFEVSGTGNNRGLIVEVAEGATGVASFELAVIDGNAESTARVVVVVVVDSSASGQPSGG